ncbi:MAG: hypothetical protein PW735_03725 [Acidobacteriaceae bacterium]|nr:hypothetical protein [Acidobacteriaceae bacterium]
MLMGMFRFSAARAAAVVTLSLLGITAGASAQVAAPGTAPMRIREAATATPAYTGPAYDNRWEAYGGLLYMNGQAGQDLQYRYNMGGGELMATYWLGKARIKKWGVAGDYRIGAGTTAVNPVANNPKYNFNRVLVMQNIVTGGVVYRTPFRNRYASVEAHALAGMAHGMYDHSIRNYPDQSALTIAACPAQVDATHPVSLGTYCNSTTGYGTAGISIDFNNSSKLAFRLQPDIIFEHYGTETREFFSVSLGAVYRFGGPSSHKKSK